MHKLYDYICDELSELEKKADRGDLSMSDIDLGDKLAHFGKNLDKIMEAKGEGYSGRMMPRYYYNDGVSYDYREDRSYAPRRDSRGRYSRDGMADKLRELMHDAPDERSKEEIRKLADKMEQM